MSSLLIIVIIVVLLVCLVSYAVISQTLASAREKRNRQISAFKTKARQLKFMLSGFPEGFLPREILLLLQKNLLDVFENLSQLEPQDSKHKEDLRWTSSLLTTTQRSPKTETGESLDNLQQIKEVKTCLEQLHRFVFQQEKKGVFNKATASSHRSQIKNMVLSLSMDSYILHGRSAQQVGKTKLALLHFEHALNLGVKEGSQNPQIIKKINFLKQKLDELGKVAAQEAATTDTTEKADDSEEADDAWQQFASETDDSWKKKHVYD